jgi:hypothetical protein
VTRDGLTGPLHAGSGIKSKIGTGGISAQTLGTILTLASSTVLSRSASCWGSWYGMARMR